MTAHAQSEELFARSQKVIPGGVSSPVRAFKGVGGTPVFIDHASGPYVTDVDGNTYIDYIQSWGASLLGHANPTVIAAVQEAASGGTTFGAPTANELHLAEAIVDAIDGVDMVRFVSSGTEATMTAIRLARGVTGRDKIVKFAGCYHGHSDALLAASGSGVLTLGLPDSKGVTKAAVADTIVAPYNVVPELTEEVACVIVEPVAANMGLVPPVPGFLEGLRAACDAVGALLIFDEVITGFRLTRGSVSALVGVQADIYCYGKVIGGGLPLAALAGPTAIMEQLAPTGPIYQAGTLSGNPLATTAGLTVLRAMSLADYEDLAAKTTVLTDGIKKAFSDAGVVAQVPVFGTLFGIYFTKTPVTDYDGACTAAANGTYAKFFHTMLDAGIMLAPSAYEVSFCSVAHTQADIEQTLAAVSNAAQMLQVI